MAPLRTGLAALAATSALLAAGLVLPAPASAAPAVGSCFDYPFSTLGKASSAAPAIGCEFPHTAETWFVGTVPDSFGPPSKASQADRLLAARPCTTKAMNAALGMPTRVLPSRYRTVVLFPTDAQWNAGERWVRCDAALQSGLQFQSTTGTAAAFVAAGHTAPGGRLPCNTGGGHLSGYYLQGVTPIAEAVRQLRGEAGEGQLEEPGLMLVTGNGGRLDYHAAVLLARGAVL